MSRHNRRRTRGGHKGKGAVAGMSLDHAEPPNSLHLYFSGSGDSGSGSGSGYTGGSTYRGSMNAFGARHWHNRYMSWQARDRRQHEEQQLALDAAKRRMFGEPGSSASEDDEALCAKMLEYFGRLDFIE